MTRITSGGDVQRVLAKMARTSELGRDEWFETIAANRHVMRGKMLEVIEFGYDGALGTQTKTLDHDLARVPVAMIHLVQSGFDIQIRSTKAQRALWTKKTVVFNFSISAVPTLIRVMLI